MSKRSGALFVRKSPAEKAQREKKQRAESGAHKVTMFPKSKDFFVERYENFAFSQVHVDKIGDRC